VVRVNLLPDKRPAARRAPSTEPKQLWLVFVLLSVVATLVVCLFIQKVKQDELQALAAENGRTQSLIDKITKQIADHDTVKSQLKSLLEREDAIKKLQSARTGPTATLLELASLLTPGRGPTTDRDRLEQMKRDNPADVANPTWDSHRLWLTSYTEHDRTLKMAGFARDGEDVSEFERRLRISDFFSDVKLLPGAKSVDPTSHQELFRFEISAQVRY
jgi:type IV pilus assembly protein PilN